MRKYSKPETLGHEVISFETTISGFHEHCNSCEGHRDKPPLPGCRNHLHYSEHGLTMPASKLRSTTATVGGFTNRPCSDSCK